MMHALLRFRLAAFALFVLFAVLNIAFAAWNLTVVGAASTSARSDQHRMLPSNFVPEVQGADIYTLIFSAISLLVVGGMLIMEQTHSGSPRLWLEVTWVGLFALLSLGSAATTTTMIPIATCGIAQAERDLHFCVSSTAVVATNWLTAITYLGWFITAIIYGVTRSSSDRDIWFKGVKCVDLRTNDVPDATLNAKIARLPALHHRPEFMTSEYSVSTVKTEKDDNSIIMPYHYRSGPIGVNAINGAPVYHPYATANPRNAEKSRITTATPVSTGNLGPTDSPQTIEVPPRRSIFVARPYALSTGGSPVEPNANAGSNPSSGFEWINTAYKHTASPSPAVIMQAHKVPTQQSLYVVGTEEYRRTRSNTDPTRGGQWFSHEQPNRSSIVLVDDRRPSETGVGLTPQARMGHILTLSTDSAFGVSSKRPKHRPPPLDLSRLSNIKQAEKR